MQQVSAVEDAATARSNLLITKSGDLVPELSVTASCIHNVRMRVTEARHYEAAIRVEIFSVGGCRGIVLNNTTTTNILAKLCDDAVFDDQVRVVQTLHMVHLSAFKLQLSLRQDSSQRTYVIYDSLHISCYLKNSTEASMRGCM